MPKGYDQTGYDPDTYTKSQPPIPLADPRQSPLTGNDRATLDAWQARNTSAGQTRVIQAIRKARGQIRDIDE